MDPGFSLSMLQLPQYLGSSLRVLLPVLPGASCSFACSTAIWLAGGQAGEVYEEEVQEGESKEVQKEEIREVQEEESKEVQEEESKEVQEEKIREVQEEVGKEVQEDESKEVEEEETRKVEEEKTKAVEEFLVPLESGTHWFDCELSLKVEKQAEHQELRDLVWTESIKLIDTALYHS